MLFPGVGSSTIATIIKGDIKVFVIKMILIRGRHIVFTTFLLVNCSFSSCYGQYFADNCLIQRETKSVVLSAKNSKYLYVSI